MAGNRQTAGSQRAPAGFGGALAVWRLLVGFVGGYALVSGFVALTGSALPLLGMERGEALSLASLFALFVYVPACLFILSTRRPWRNGTIMLMLAAAMIAAAVVI